MRPEPLAGRLSGPTEYPAARTAVRRAATLAGALVAGYAFTFGFSALGMAALAGFGVDFHEAEKALMLAALPLFLVLFLLAFASARPGRFLAATAGGAALMLASAMALQKATAG